MARRKLPGLPPAGGLPTAQQDAALFDAGGPRTEAEAAVYSELFHRGQGTARQLAARLARRGQRYTVAEVQAALDGWAARGWVSTTGGRSHLSAAALAYLR